MVEEKELEIKEQELVKILEQILYLEPQYREAERLLKKLKGRQEFFNKGKSHFDKGHYKEALGCFYKACEVGGNYQGTFNFIAESEELLKKEVVVPSLKEHFGEVVEPLLEGKLVFFLGLDINPTQRPPDVRWKLEEGYLPSRQELAAYLANKDIEGKGFNLAKVTQDFVATRKYKYRPLYDKLDKVYKKNHRSLPIHHFFVNLTKQLARISEPKYPIIITTNYDDALEQTFKEAYQSFDLLYPLPRYHGKFAHAYFDSETGYAKPEIIEEPNKHLLRPYQRPLIIKANGITDYQKQIMIDAGGESNYMITEDDHLGNLAYGGISERIPARILAQLKQNGFLSLGMDLKDWSTRNIFRRIWGNQVEYPSWVIQADIDEEGEKFWNLYSVNIVKVTLNRYIASLTAEIDKVSF